MKNDATKCWTVNRSFWLSKTCTPVFQLLITSPYCLTIPQYEYEEWWTKCLLWTKPLIGYCKPSLNNQNIFPLSSVPFKRVSTISGWRFVIQNVQFKSCAHNPSFMKVFLKCNVAVESSGWLWWKQSFLVFCPNFGPRRQPQCWFSRFHKSSENIFLFISGEGGSGELIMEEQAGCSDGCATRKTVTLC